MPINIILDDQLAAELESEAGKHQLPMQQWIVEVLRRSVARKNGASAVESGDWSEEKNERRIELIDKKIQGDLSETETLELENLQQQAIAWRDSISGPPLDAAKQLHAQLLKKAGGKR